MASKNTGFHPSDADWTQGRAQALADANSIARRQDGLTRKVAMTPAEAANETPMQVARRHSFPHVAALIVLTE